MEIIPFGEEVIADKVIKIPQNELVTLERDEHLLVLDIIYLDRIKNHIAILREINTKKVYYAIDIDNIQLMPRLVWDEYKWKLSENNEFPSLTFYTNVRRLEKIYRKKR